MRRPLLALLLAACGAAKPETTVPAPPPGAPPEVAAADPVPPPPPAPKGSTATKIRMVEGITEYKLDSNGLTVLLFPDSTQSTVTVNITYLVGSRVEGYGETGMAHLLEHMMFKGSPKHRNVLKLLGAKGGQANGTTWTDRTNYFETLPANQENLDWTLELEADRMINAEISPDDLKTEFSVVRNEFEKDENDPLAMMYERIVSTAYLWHNYGKDTIGNKTDIERVPVPALRRFYEKYYQPDNAVLIVSGKFDDTAALASIGKTFGIIPKPTRVIEPSYTVEPVQDGERSVVLRRNGDVNAVGIAYHTVGAASPDYPAVQAALDVLTREPSGRLYKKLVETKLASSVEGDQRHFRDPFLAVFTGVTRDAKNVDKIEQTMIAETEGLANSKLDDKEIERWRANTLKHFDLDITDSRQIAIRLSEFAALGDWRTLFAYRNRVEKVTAADVQRVAKLFFKQSNRTTGRFIPTKDADRAPFVETPNVAAAIEGVKEGTTPELGETFVATLDNIEARTQHRELKNGIKVAFLPKKTRGGVVKFDLTLHFGDAKNLQNKSAIASLMGEVMARGTAKKTYQDINDTRDQLRVLFGVSAGASSLNLHMETMRDRLPAALDFAAEILLTPSFPAKELELVRQEELTNLEQARTDPGSLAWTTLGQLGHPWPKSDPRYTESAAERIAAIKAVQVGDLKAFYRDFVGSGHGELVVIGDFDPDALAAQFDKLLGGWTSKKPYARLDDKVFEVAATTKSIDVRDKEMTQLTLSHAVAMKDSDADYPAWLMVGQILGGDAGSRVWMRLREHEGLSYGAGAWTYAAAQDEVGGVSGYAIVAPQNLAKAKASILDEFTKMSTSKVTDEELAHAKDEWTKQQDTSLSNDGYVANQLANNLFLGRTLAHRAALRAKVAAVTTADVERVAKKWLHPDKLVIVDAGDQKKATAP